jgi:hypothetical protein
VIGKSLIEFELAPHLHFSLTADTQYTPFAHGNMRGRGHVVIHRENFSGSENRGIFHNNRLNLASGTSMETAPGFARTRSQYGHRYQLNRAVVSDETPQAQERQMTWACL